MIQKERLQKDFDAMAQLTGLGEGVNRLAFTDADWEGRQYIIDCMNDAGLDVEIDGFGNVIGYKVGTNPDLPVVMVGSHTDSVPNGGNYDGVVGVLSAIEAVRSMIDDGFEQEHTIAVVDFICEESSRFGAATLGSKAMRGKLTLNDLHRLVDTQGITLYDVLKGRNLNPDAIESMAYKRPVKAFIEIHIEQGKVLEHEQKQIGIVSGIAAAAKLKNPRVKIIGVEPEGAASALAALKADHPVPLDEVATIADGTAVRQIGETTLEYIKQYVDEIITVSDYELMEAFLLLVEKHKLVAENSGILPLAGLRKLNCTGKKVVAIVSGGNIDVLTISSMINKGLVVRGRIFTFSVNLPDKPGQLVAVSQMLAEADANVIKLDHNQFKNLDRFHEVELQVTVETNGEEHIQQIIDTFKNNGYIIKRLNSSETLSE